MADQGKNVCVTCGDAERCRDSAWSWAFFAVGIIATFSVRLVVVFMSHNVIYARIAWYVGVSGFFLFFLYKFHIERIRSELIARSGISKKIAAKEPLAEADYSLIGTLLCGLRSNKDRINYFIIFSTSVITILLALYEDFFRSRF